MRRRAIALTIDRLVIHGLGLIGAVESHVVLHQIGIIGDVSGKQLEGFLCFGNCFFILAQILVSIRSIVGCVVSWMGLSIQVIRLDGLLQFPQLRKTQLRGRNLNMITRIWHGATPATKSDEYLNLMRTVAIPDYRSTPGN
jgi:hypothetical protein